MMKAEFDIDDNLEETEIVIKTPTLTDEIADLQRLLQESKAPLEVDFLYGVLGNVI